MDPSQITGLALGFGSLALALLIWFIRANMVLCQPNELVVIAGRQRKQPDGSTVGYRVIRGGRGFKMPLVESVARLPLTNLTLEVKIGKAMAKGMIPVSVDARATVKLAGRAEDGVEAAIERFLGKGPDPIIRSAQQAIEGALRGLLATMAPEEANANRRELAKGVLEQARAELQHLGIVLDLFQIRDISDGQGYLEAIGRQRAAAVKRDTRIAEATAEAEARTVAAEQGRVGREAEIAAELKVIENENALAVRRADLASKAHSAEAKAAVAGPIAKVSQEITLQSKRVELATQRSNADVVIPARAERQAAEQRAQGKAASILADGKATAEAVELMRAQWEDGATKDLFMIRLLPELTEQVTRVVSENLHVDRLTILDGGHGDGIPNYVRNLTNSAVVMMEQVQNATGVDMTKIASPNQNGAALPPGMS